MLFANAPIAMQLQRVRDNTLVFIQVPGFPSAIRVFALTHSRRNVVQRYPWLISFSLDPEPPCISSCFSSRQTVSAITTTLVALERQRIAELGEGAVDGHDI